MIMTVTFIFCLKMTTGISYDVENAGVLLQVGQEFLILSHWAMHFEWNVWQQFSKSLMISPLAIVSRQIVHVSLTESAFRPIGTAIKGDVVDSWFWFCMKPCEFTKSWNPEWAPRWLEEAELPVRTGDCLPVKGILFIGILSRKRDSHLLHSNWIFFEIYSNWHWKHMILYWISLILFLYCSVGSYICSSIQKTIF